MKISARKIKDGIQNGFGYEQFMEKYDCSKEEVEKSVSFAYSRNQSDRDDILKQIEKNSKKRRKSKKANEEAPIDTVETTVTSDVRPEVKPEPKPAHDLVSLKRHEKNLSKTIQALESEHKNLVAKRREKYVALGSLHEKFVELKTQFEETLEAFDAKSGEIEEISQLIANKTSQIGSEKAKLYDVRSEIESLSEIMVFVYENGEIELSNGEFYNADTELDAEMILLAKNPICQELKIKELQTLSNVIMIKRGYQDSEFNVQFVFDNENIELVFNTL